jgi:hypothetical protein
VNKFYYLLRHLQDTNTCIFTSKKSLIIPKRYNQNAINRRKDNIRVTIPHLPSTYILTILSSSSVYWRRSQYPLTFHEWITIVVKYKFCLIGHTHAFSWNGTDPWTTTCRPSVIPPGIVPTYGSAWNKTISAYISTTLSFTFTFDSYQLIDWLVFNTNFSSISAISWGEQILLFT